MQLSQIQEEAEVPEEIDARKFSIISFNNVKSEQLLPIPE